MTNRELDAAIAEALGLPPVEELRPAVPSRGWPALHGWRVNPLGDDDLVDEFIYSPDGGDAVLSPTGFVSGFAPPRYSTDPVAADALMRALVEREFEFTIGLRLAGWRPRVAIRHRTWAGSEAFYAETWTLALAKAALSALTAGKP